MSETTLQQMLEQKENALELVLSIDQVRDSMNEPAVMLSDIVSILVKLFRAELGLLVLVDPDTTELELKTIHDRGEVFGLIESSVYALASRALDEGQMIFWDSEGTHPVYVAVVPILMEKTRLGVLFLGRSKARFADHEVDLLTLAESQLDSAVVQAHASYEIQQRNKELEIVYRVDRIRDMGLPFDEMLNMVLNELCIVLQAEIGFILLYDKAGRRLELRASTHDDLFKMASCQEVVRRVADEALQVADLVGYNDLRGELNAILSIPLILQDSVIGVFGAANRDRSQDFSNDDGRLLRAIASQMDTAIFENLERRQLRQLLSRSVDPHVLERILANPSEDFLKGERAVVTVLYADLRGSTRLAEQIEPEILVAFINDYLARMTDVILSHGGTLDKFTGDGVMALFGAPFAYPDHALRAVRTSFEMQTVHQQIMNDWQAKGLEAPTAGIGIATGELIAGELGSPQRTVYSVIGRAANLGARLCDVAQGGQVVVCQATHDLIAEQVQMIPISGLHLKGVEGEVTAYRISQLLV